MSSKKLELFKIFDDTSNFLSKHNLQIDQSKVDEILSAFYSAGLSYHGVFDFNQRKFVYVSCSVYDFLGEPHETFTLEHLLDRIHPDDMQYFLKANKIAAYFLFKYIPKESIPDYKVSYQFRMRDKQGAYRLILHQAIPLSLDAEMNLATALINQSDISHISTENSFKISFINIRGNQSYYNIQSISDLLIKVKASRKLLSKREMEILSYLSKGYSTKEIAENLLISSTTVRTHRNNILKKTGFKTISQSIGYFIRKGII